MWDVEFSFALRNRTGKFYIGRDIIERNRDLIANVRYGRLVARRTPEGTPARLLSTLIGREATVRARRPGLGGLVSPARPVAHLDPFSVLIYALSERDAVLCHDLGPITHPDLFAPDVEALYHAAYAKVAEAQPALVFVSRASQNAYVRHFGALERMRVIYPPLRAELGAVAATPVAGLRAPFLLTVGSIGRRKNQDATIAAFAASGLAERGWSYVLCGVREPGSEAAIARARATPGVVVLSYVPDGELVWLYRNAAGFVLVSRLEGFGVPVAEAIAAGLVPLVTRNSVLEEVAGDGALTAAPDDVADIAARLGELARMPPDEAARRKALLSQSITRFTPAAFQAGWREVLRQEEKKIALASTAAGV